MSSPNEPYSDTVPNAIPSASSRIAAIIARKAAAGAFNFNLAFWLLYLISWLLIFTTDDRPYDYPFQIRVLS